LTHAQLAAKIESGDTLTIMGVPPGSGRRLGVDRDLDGVLDADVLPPGLQIAVTASNVVLSWPVAAVGFVLEVTPDLSHQSWTNVPALVEVIGGQNFVTNTPAGSLEFYRLRLQ